MCGLILMYCVMFVCNVLCVCVFVRVVVKRVCVSFATSRLMLFGLRFVCDLMCVVGCVCVLSVMYSVMLYGVLSCVRDCCACVWCV